MTLNWTKYGNVHEAQIPDGRLAVVWGHSASDRLWLIFASDGETVEEVSPIHYGNAFHAKRAVERYLDPPRKRKRRRRPRREAEW